MSETAVVESVGKKRRIPKGFKVSMFVDKIGLEFEGGWDRRCIKPYDIQKSAAENSTEGNHNMYCSCISERNVGDGSVDCPGDWNGEVPTKPFHPTPEALDHEFQWYPQYGNRTCGMHLHISFKRQYYYRRLMSPEFYEFFKKELRAWGERYGVKNTQFYSRLNGENHYCKDEWLMEAQVNTREKDSCRYAILNYCYNLHKTLEVRVLPYFKSADTAKAAVKACLNIICDWLYQHRGKRPVEARAECYVDAEVVAELPSYTLEVTTPDFTRFLDRYGAEFPLQPQLVDRPAASESTEAAVRERVVARVAGNPTRDFRASVSETLNEALRYSEFEIPF